MKKFLGVCLIILFVFPAVLSFVSCAKKDIEATPSMESEEMTDEEPADDTDKADMEAKEMEEKRLEEERMAAEDARLQAEQEAMAAREMFISEDIHYDFDSAVILADAQAILQEKAAWMNDNPDAAIIVEGHCDERGTEAYNLALGERRAAAAKNYLIDLGIDSQRILTISYGEERPIDPSKTEAAWAKNRRAHFTIE